MDQEVRYRYKSQRNIVIQVREMAVKPHLIKQQDGKIQGFRWKRF